VERREFAGVVVVKGEGEILVDECVLGVGWLEFFW